MREISELSDSFAKDQFQEEENDNKQRRTGGVLTLPAANANPPEPLNATRTQQHKKTVPIIKPDKTQSAKTQPRR